MLVLGLLGKAHQCQLRPQKQESKLNREWYLSKNDLWWERIPPFPLPPLATSRSLDSFVLFSPGRSCFLQKGLCKQDKVRAVPSAHLSWGWDTAVTAKLLQLCSRCWQPCWGKLSALWWELTNNFHPALLALAGVSLKVVLSKVPFICSPWSWPSVCDPLSSGPLVLTCLVCSGHVMTQGLQWN